tara:strand:- start:1076 stop:1417 length:342 start_codon:yes stop_codon:yes gene_type:complete
MVPTQTLRRAASTVALLVSIRIRPDRLTEFINIIEADALGSRQEPGCLRFDVLRDPHDDHRFHLYEMYRDEAAASLHREQPHFALWADFKASGGTFAEEQTKLEADVLFTDAA